jgi:DNA repair exonuclease SbcCD ATPase subunit
MTMSKTDTLSSDLEEIKDTIIKGLQQQVKNLKQQLSERDELLLSVLNKNAETNRELEKAVERLHIIEQVTTATKVRQVQESFRRSDSMKHNRSLKHLSDTLQRKQHERRSLRDDAEHVIEIEQLRGLLRNRLDTACVAAEMYQDNALTLEELEIIQECVGGPCKAAETLIDIIQRQPYEVYKCFLSALKRIQEDIYVALVYKGMFSLFIEKNLFAAELNV